MNASKIKDLESLEFGSHICSLYKNEDQKLSTAAAFIECGLKNNEKCILVLPKSSQEGIKSILKKTGIDIQRHLDSDQLVFSNITPKSLKDLIRDRNKLEETGKQAIDSALGKGWRGLRFAQEMEWILDDPSCFKKLVEFETNLNCFLLGKPILGMCQYSEDKFPEDTLTSVIETHPYILTSGLLCRNLYYVTPDELLAKQNQSQKKLARYLHNIREKRELELQSELSRRYKHLNEYDRSVVDKFVEALLDLNGETREAFVELFGKKRYGSFCLIFKAGQCIGFDWTSSHRRK